MNYVLLQPHQDDAALFASFTCYLYKPLVVTVLQSYIQQQRGTGITNDQRQMENADAMEALGCEWEEWEFRDDVPDWDRIRDRIILLAEHHDHCFAPAVEPAGGHHHHDRIGQLAAEAFPNRVTHYTTYVNGRGRSVGIREVTPAPGAVSAKLRALACYTSQINEPSTGHHFLQPLTEWYQ